MFEKDLIVYFGGPLDDGPAHWTHAEDVRNCRDQPDGSYKADGIGDYRGQFVQRRVWVADA